MSNCLLRLTTWRAGTMVDNPWEIQRLLPRREIIKRWVYFYWHTGYSACDHGHTAFWRSWLLTDAAKTISFVNNVLRNYTVLFDFNEACYLTVQRWCNVCRSKLDVGLCGIGGTGAQPLANLHYSRCYWLCIIDFKYFELLCSSQVNYLLNLTSLINVLWIINAIHNRKKCICSNPCTLRLSFVVYNYPVDLELCRSKYHWVGSFVLDWKWEKWQFVLFFRSVPFCPVLFWSVLSSSVLLFRFISRYSINASDRDPGFRS